MELNDYLALQNKRRKPHRQEESEIQMKVVLWLQQNHPDVIFTSALGGIKTTIGQAVKLKRLGYRRGWPDLFIAEPRRGFIGLFVELKTLTGKIDLDQVKMRNDLSNRGYCAKIIRGYDLAIEEIDWYLKG